MPAGGGPVALRAVGWGWRHATRSAWALRGVDLDVAPGERVLLLGPSGSGKSTLLAGLAGLLDGGPDGTGEAEGELLVDGLPAGRARAESIGSGAARTGLLLQDPAAQTVLARCGDDVAFGLENHALDPGLIWPRVAGALAGVAFPYPPGHLTAHLSGGERQRLALAGVLALRPGLLLLDEPTAMLDPDGAARLREQVGAVLAATGATCLLVEHRLARWVPLVDRVVVVAAGGGVVADGPPAEVFGRRGADLAAAGVWVPGHRPAVSRRPRAVVGAASPAGASPDGGAALLTADGVAVRRPGSAAPAVRGVDLTLHAGRATCVVGPNGSGKSSLALALAGLVMPAEGEVRAAPPLAEGTRSVHPARWRPRELVRRIGTVFQEPQHQFVARTCLDELAVGPLRTGLPDAQARVRAAGLLDRIGLAPLARANPFTLSGGEQRRLSVATALATGPRLLVLDEPTFGQDSRTWAHLVDLLVELLADGTGILAVTHDDALVDALADDVLTLRGGRPVGAEPARTGEASR